MTSRLSEATIPLSLKAPVAQLDRVSASEAEGHAFESHRVRHTLFQGTPAFLILNFPLKISFLILDVRFIER